MPLCEKHRGPVAVYYENKQNQALYRQKEIGRSGMVVTCLHVGGTIWG